jgi:hypothetical protein
MLSVEAFCRTIGPQGDFHKLRESIDWNGAGLPYNQPS